MPALILPLGLSALYAGLILTYFSASGGGFGSGPAGGSGGGPRLHLWRAPHRNDTLDAVLQLVTDLYHGGHVTYHPVGAAVVVDGHTVAHRFVRRRAEGPARALEACRLHQAGIDHGFVEVAAEGVCCCGHLGFAEADLAPAQHLAVDPACLIGPRMVGRTAMEEEIIRDDPFCPLRIETELAI